MRFIEKGNGKGSSEKRRGKRDGDMVTGKGEPNGFWEYGGCCLGNRCIGRTVAYMMSQVSEVLIPTVRTSDGSWSCLCPDSLT